MRRQQANRLSSLLLFRKHTDFADQMKQYDRKIDDTSTTATVK